MNKIAWIVFACLIDAVGLAVLLGLYLKRNHNFIRFRNFPLLFIQIVGLLVSMNLASFYLGLKPHFSCYAKFGHNLVAFAGFALPFGLRCWEYSVNFHIAKARTKFREGEIHADWFVRNRWCVRPKLLLIIYGVGLVLLFIPMIPYTIEADEYYYNAAEECLDAAGSKLVTTAFFVFFVALAFFSAYLMYGSKDVFYVKPELIGMAVTWCVVLLIWAPISLAASDAVIRRMPPTFWVNMGLTISIGWNGIFPLILVYKFADSGKLTVGSEMYTLFLSQLDELQFRNNFHDYMVRQFCQENILFYEVATEWKNNRRASQARYIYDNFIREGSICQINISQLQSAAICDGLANPEISPAIFDDALRTVTEIMYANSYILFARQKERRASESTASLSTRMSV